MIERDWNWGSWGKVFVPVIEHTGPQLGESQKGHQTCTSANPLFMWAWSSVVATVIKGQYDENFDSWSHRGKAGLWEVYCICDLWEEHRQLLSTLFFETLQTVLKAWGGTLHFLLFCVCVGIKRLVGSTLQEKKTYMKPFFRELGVGCITQRVKLLAGKVMRQVIVYCHSFPRSS